MQNTGYLADVFLGSKDASKLFAPVWPQEMSGIKRIVFSSGKEKFRIPRNADVILGVR